MAASTTDAQPPLAKYLASSDNKTRDRAIHNLATFLSDPSHHALSDLEMGKLWKGIFYSFWMSDKPLVQQALASELAEILLTITAPSASLDFLKGFWDTIVREWNGIDRLRMDKYYLLVRRFLNSSFRLLTRHAWDRSLCEKYNEILTRKGGPLCPSDIRVPASLSYHLCDIYLEELNKASKTSHTSGNQNPVPLFTILKPFIIFAAQTPTKTTYQHVQSTIIDPLLTELQSDSLTPSDENPSSRKRKMSRGSEHANLLSSACISDPAKEGSVAKDQLKITLLRKIFDIASEQDTKDANRRRLYAVWKAYTSDDELES